MEMNDFINAMYYMRYYGSYNAACTNRINRKHIIKRKLKAQKGEEL